MRLAKDSYPTVAPRLSVTRSHLHLWTLSDGTGLHAPYAELAVDQETLRLCCHLCGKWFVSLGSHVRAHGHTADSYRQAMGLCDTTALTCSALSTSIAERQSEGYRRDPQVRENLRDGRAARKTQTSALTVLDALTTPPVPSAAIVEPAQRVRRRRAALAAGRATAAARREQALASMLAERGYDCLHDFLRRSYAEGADLEGLARTTGLGRARLRREVEIAGITVRAVGHNTAEAKRSRTRANDAAAAQRVGSDDIRTWLSARHNEGWSVARMSREVGRSVPWINHRLKRAEPAARQASHETHVHTGVAL